MILVKTLSRNVIILIHRTFLSLWANLTKYHIHVDKTSVAAAI